MSKPLRVLIVEDSEDDALLTIRALKKGGYEPVYERVEDVVAMRAALQEKTWDVILCDYRLPQFNGLAAIALLKDTGIDLPLIIVSGAIGEETAADCMRYGAHDYVMKGKLSRLAPAIERVLIEADSRIKRRQAEEALQESEERYRVLFEGSTYGILMTDIGTGRFVDANLSICRMLGYSKAELLQLGISDIHPKDLRDHVMSEIESQGRGGQPVSRAIPCLRKDGTVFYADIVGANTNFHGRRCAVGFLIDITDRKQAEEDLKRTEERYRSIFENAQEGIFRSTPEEKIIMANPAMAKIFGYASPEELMTGITDVIRQHYVNPEDRRKIKEMIEEHGFIKGYEVQNNRKDGSIIWISLTMQVVRDEKGQLMYYDGIVEDITNRKQRVERIRKALGATVQAIAVTVEARDPYTAGHQRRVADLTRAMATEMNLPADQIDGIHMAAAIHDLGKISVPAEILSKPTKLTALEFSLIKTHAQSGSDILKDIDFPWPVARTVMEHHERMNGSGYPQSLTGDNILLESRILAVADVVEAMASHRPYRPTLGIDAAMKEIESNRGILYDINAVNACLRLFREKGYQLEGK